MLSANSIIEYQNMAVELSLWEEREWHLLLHSENSESEIDSQNFFLSPKGKISPKDELLKTVESLYSTSDLEDNSTFCKFPARREWLTGKLKLENLPNVECKEYNKWIEVVDPKSVSLIFSSAHINSPASMFGHTFLRINSSFNSRLLSYAINYAADADQGSENGVIFAIKGLFGGYFGTYSMLPYYDKLKEYRDTEQRDIWEYDLNLNEDEVRKMVDHIWEISNTYSYYYFFTENCSYNMLWLLEVARPSIRLREQFIYQVSPPETIFAIENENLIKDRNYRPSKRTKIVAYEKLLKESYIGIAKKLSLGKIEAGKVLSDKNISKTDKQNIFEVAIELCEYNYIKRVIEKDKYLKVFHNLSKSRASLGYKKKIEIETPTNPIDGHRQLKLSLGYQQNSKKDYLTIGLRPTYHDLTNSDGGFLRGTQIEFFDFQARHREDKLQIDYFKLLTISSIAPKTAFFNPISWTTAWQYDRDGLDNKLDFSGRVSGGYSLPIFNGYSYLLGDFSVYSNDYSYLSLGLTTGLVLYSDKYLKTNIEAVYKKFDSLDEQKIFNFTLSYFPEKEFDLKFIYRYIDKFQKDQNSLSLQLNYFF